MRIQHRYQDVVIINVGKYKTPIKKRALTQFLQFLLILLATLLLLTLGYLACVKAGLIAPPHSNCCFGILELNFDFDFDSPDTDA